MAGETQDIGFERVVVIIKVTSSPQGIEHKIQPPKNNMMPYCNSVRPRHRIIPY